MIVEIMYIITVKGPVASLLVVHTADVKDPAAGFLVFSTALQETASTKRNCCMLRVLPFLAGLVDRFGERHLKVVYD